MQIKLKMLVGMILISISSFSKPSFGFENTFKRYLSGHDVMRMVEHTFPLIGNYGNCQLDGAKIDLVGFSKPQTGISTSKTPGPLFLDWYMTCLKTQIPTSISQTPDRYFPAKLIEKEQYLRYRNWSALDPNLRTDLIRFWIHLVLGPGILKDEASLIRDYDAKLMANKSEITSDAAAQSILYSLALRDEFLSY